MKKYEYKFSAFGRMRQEKAKENKIANTKKVQKVYPWKSYSII